MSERILSVGGPAASRPISDFLMVNDYQGPKAGKYYVDLNVAATGSGSPDHPFATYAEAVTASNASIGLAANRWWARRNYIYVCGDGIEEDLTILPEKCDTIGCGSDLYPFPRIIGNHAIAATRPTAGKATACRFINMGFQDADGTADLFSAPAGCHGLQFIGCTATAKTGGSAGKAFEITNCAHVRFIDIDIVPTVGSMTNIFAVGISIEGLASIHDTQIKGGLIVGTVGVHVVEATAAAMGSRIKGVTIRATGLTINDASGDFIVTDNNLISDAADDGSGTGGGALAVKCNIQLAAGNRVTSSDHVNAPFPIQATLS